MTNPTLADLHALYLDALPGHRPAILEYAREWAATHALTLGTKGSNVRLRRREAILALLSVGAFVMDARTPDGLPYQVTPEGEWLAEHVLERPLPALRWGA